MSDTEIYVALDVMGIQRSIFETNRLKIILGASLQLADWQVECKKRAKDHNGMLISSAGGNVLAKFNDEKNADDFRKEACKKAFEESGFRTAWAKAYRNAQETDFVIWKELRHKLALFQTGNREEEDYINSGFNRGVAQIDYPICNQCGLRISNPSYVKKNIYDNPSICNICYNRYSHSLDAESISVDDPPLRRLSQDFSFYDEFEDIARVPSKEDEFEQIAVIVVDLNDMGKKIDKIINNNNFDGLSLFSGELSNDQYEIYRDVIKEVFKPKEKEKLRCRPIVLAGDDAVIVVPESNWVQFIEKLFEKLKGKEYYASAGIVIGKYNYPFNRLVEMAEELVNNAKQWLRWQKANGEFDGDEFKIDWHIHQESVLTSIREARKRRLVRADSKGKKIFIATAKPYSFKEFKELREKQNKYWKKDKKEGDKAIKINISNRKLYSLYRAILLGPEKTRDELVYNFFRHESDDLTEYPGIWEAIKEINSGNESNHSYPLWEKDKPERDNKREVYRTSIADNLELFWMEQSSSKEGE